uniref:Amino acid transporter transmembrane domain-containing protein n=1 Tax=Meloidogyne floridensis TaxID=298350 RepID=A0A915P115_9BILA
LINPVDFIAANGVLNTACFIVLAVYATTGFYGYLAFGSHVKDTVTLNLPNEPANGTCLIAELIPHLGLFISLVGAFAGTALALIFPAMIDLLCNYSQMKLTRGIWIKNIFLFGFGVLGLVTGTYASLTQIAYAFGVEDKT